MSTLEKTMVKFPTDPKYSLFKNPVNIDADTSYIQSKKISAISNGVGSIALTNVLNGKNTIFEFTSDANSKLDWNSSYLSVSFALSTLSSGDGVLLPADDAAVSVFDLARAISSISISFNNQSPAVYRAEGDTFLYNYLTMLLLNYDRETLKNMDDELMLPLYSDNVVDKYAKISDADLSYTQKLRMAKLGVPDTLRYNSDLNGIAQTANTSTGEITITAGQSINANAVLAKIYSKKIALANIIRMANGLSDNIRSVKIEITWNALSNMSLEVTSGKYGYMRIIESNIYAQMFYPSPLKYTENLKKDTEYIAFMCPSSTNEAYIANSDLNLGSKANLNSLFVYRTAKDNTIYNSTGASASQLLLGAVNASGDILYADQLNQYNTCYSSVQMSYGNIVYPQEAIKIRDATTYNIDLHALYEEYVKAVGLNLGYDHSSRVAIPFSVFSTTFPFIALSPFSNNPKLSSKAENLRLMIRGSTSCNVVVTVVQTKILMIEVSGLISVN